MRDHDHQHMPVPRKVSPCLIMAHAKITFAFLETLLNRPAHGCQAVKNGLADIARRVTEKVFDFLVCIFTDIQPYFFPRPQILITRVKAPAGKTADTFHIGYNRPLNTFTQNTAFPWYGIIGRYRFNRYGRNGRFQRGAMKPKGTWKRRLRVVAQPPMAVGRPARVGRTRNAPDGSGAGDTQRRQTWPAPRLFRIQLISNPISEAGC